jgi:hypothetical protein
MQPMTGIPVDVPDPSMAIFMGFFPDQFFDMFLSGEIGLPEQREKTVLYPDPS